MDASYDAFGNRTAQVSQGTACPTVPSVPSPTVTYNASNQVTWVQNIAPAGFAYDGAGNVTSDNNNQYAYDAEGRICAVENFSATGGTVLTQYIYDAEGNRVAKGSIQLVMVNNIPTLSCDTTQNGFTPTNSYVLGPSDEQLTETDGNGNWKHSNVYAAGSIIATYDIAPTGNPALHFQLEDWLGTRRVQTDISGCPEEAFTGLPFGDGLTVVPVAPCASGTADDATENHFTGKEHDTESGNDYFGARYFASSMGRFLSPDWSAKAEPIPYAKLDDPQSLNLYAYVRNNPLNMIDKDGHFFHWCSESGTAVCDDGERGTPPEGWTPAPKQYFKTLDEAQNAGANASFQAMVNNGIHQEWGSASYRAANGLYTNTDPRILGPACSADATECDSYRANVLKMYGNVPQDATPIDPKEFGSDHTHPWVGGDHQFDGDFLLHPSDPINFRFEYVSGPSSDKPSQWGINPNIFRLDYNADNPSVCKISGPSTVPSCN